MNNKFPKRGLTTKEALERLKKEGLNSLPQKDRRTFFTIILETLHEPMFLLLLSAGLIYLFIGELKEGLSLFVFVNLIIGIKLYQEGKTERTLEALRDMASPRALTLRDGKLSYISGIEVVRGDIIFLKEGDRIPADGFLISANNLEIDESLLTGESVPVSKRAIPSPVYSGTLVVVGEGIFEVNATGKNTEMGRIGVTLKSIKAEISPLHKQTTSLVKTLAIIGFLFCILIILINGMMHGDWLRSTLLGIALLMSMIPEEFLVVLTIFPTLGAWRLSSEKVLTRRISAIETLGSTSVLCVDKTGTITQNKMAVTELWAEGSFYNACSSQDTISAFFHPLVEYAILASSTQPFDPMEKALYQFGEEHLKKSKWLHIDWELIHQYPLTPELPVMSQIWKTKELDYIIASKGSPEAIMDLCCMTKDTKQQISIILKQMAEHGLRILGIAKGNHSENLFPPKQKDLTLEFLGLIGFSDPLRRGIKQSMQECDRAGIRVIMITGDYPLTAKAIGEQAGLYSKEILTGNELNKLSEVAFQNKILTTNICARITSSQKFRIVKALKANKYIVAMTGDGVNDAPALKSAHVGIAMGNRGTDVAREASTLVLLDDNFSSIISAIRTGRRIFDNMQKSMAFILAVHIPIAGIALFPIILNLPPVFYPLHIALIELIIDPTCSIAFENEPAEKDLMKRKPRKIDDPILSKKMIWSSLVQGIGVLVINLTMYIFALGLMPEDKARTFAFTSLIVSNLMLIYSSRSTSLPITKLLTIPNKILIWITGITLLILLLTIYLPFFANLLHFSPLTKNQLLSSLIGPSLCILWFETVKLFFNQLFKEKKQ